MGVATGPVSRRGRGILGYGRGTGREMADPLVRTRQCPSCGAEVAAHLAVCPYCEQELSDRERLPSDVHDALTERIASLAWSMDPGLPGRLLAWLPAVWIVALPLVLAACLVLAFGSWLLATSFLVSALAVGSILARSLYEWVTYGSVAQRRVWRRRHRPALVRLLRQRGLPPSAYREVVLDYLVRQGAPGLSDLGVMLDE